jgi:DNA polymerase-3 subunit epsilon
VSGRPPTTKTVSLKAIARIPPIRTPDPFAIDRPVVTAELTPHLPDSPGVYLFMDAEGTILYVGKSKSVRSRVKAHFAARNERRMMRRVRRVEVRETAGELGALLLESKLIKELRPLFNVMSRRRRRIIAARRSVDKRGYHTVALTAIDYFSIKPKMPVLGIFKTRTQAKEFLTAAAREYRLCPKLMRLETPSRYCFSYHLGRCSGACMGEEDPAAYNARVEQAFDARRIKAWPYPGPVIVEEQSPRAESRELFLVDNWCLLGSVTRADSGLSPSLPGAHRFDYDSYRILYAYLTDERNAPTIRTPDRAELRALTSRVSQLPRSPRSVRT